MRVIIAGILLLAQCFALRVTGSVEAAVLSPAGQDNYSLRILNDMSQRAEVTASVYLDKFPEGAADKVTLRLPPNNFSLGARGSRYYSWQAFSAEDAVPGEYLFWLVFSADIHTQNSEAGNFVVQDTAYFPVWIIIENSDS